MVTVALVLWPKSDGSAPWEGTPQIYDHLFIPRIILVIIEFAILLTVLVHLYKYQLAKPEYAAQVVQSRSSLSSVIR